MDSQSHKSTINLPVLIPAIFFFLKQKKRKFSVSSRKDDLSTKSYCCTSFLIESTISFTDCSPSIGTR